MSSLVSSSNDDEGCIIHFIGLDVIMTCVGELLAWFVGRISKVHLLTHHCGCLQAHKAQVSVGSMCLLVQAVTGLCLGHCCHLWVGEGKHSWILMSKVHSFFKGSCCL